MPAPPRCFAQINLDDFNLSSSPNSGAACVAQANGGTKVKSWCHAHQGPLMLKDDLAEHLGLLLPLLLCGEQSAQWVFSVQSRRAGRRGEQQAAQQLQSIGQEEFWHDQALTHVASQVPQHVDALVAQQQAQAFYRQLAKGHSLAEHFVSISVLDMLVAQLMHQLAHYQWSLNRDFAVLCQLIAKDETKHVYMSRYYAKSLGANADDFHFYRQQVNARLGELLLPYQQHFEAVGIDLEQLFTRRGHERQVC
ncbi:hypothetical protein [Shewanella sp. NIFS-20-20]|uniref:hypothetical protein n=1 Tax=Shewanella sp. NIFS-20-20 TaxID=2853806 RepID=UPI001C46203B|nr:hypothetical protein [Shewanella sp. NIFS-20-20]MBV7315969.1 hypothetical protein [Shewanella sp. NIFS-20-20]